MKKVYLFLLVTLGCFSFSYSQVTVKGTVVSETDRMPIPSASIIVKGNAQMGTSTDFDGNFTLNLSEENGTLVISSLGFATQEIPYSGDETLNIAMTEEASFLDEVVLIGYGSSKKGDLTSAIATVNNVETIASRPVSNVTEFLQGNVAGVTVLSQGGDPTASGNVVIRGWELSPMKVRLP